MTTVPSPVIVTVLPLIVAGPESTLNVTGKPEDEFAKMLNGESPKVLLASSPNAIAWFSFPLLEL